MKTFGRDTSVAVTSVAVFKTLFRITIMVKAMVINLMKGLIEQ